MESENLTKSIPQWMKILFGTKIC
jgi:hypothetical protein